MRALISCFMFLVIAGGAQAEQPYMDDRSDAVSLISSFYNALNRKEYARAWSYFAEPPATSFEDFVKGYEDTESVEFLTGAAASEGAAGSIFTTVPVALRASGKGEERYFAGCYTVRATNAAIQEPPYRPLVIETGKFKAAKEAELSAVLPPSCGNTPDGNKDQALLDDFKRQFGRSLLAECRMAAEALADEKAITVNRLEWRYSDQGASDEPNLAQLLAIPCDFAAYNSTEIYYLRQSDTGFRRLSFAMPDFDIKYSDENNEKLSRLAVTGFVSEETLINSEFDQKSSSITMYSKWRGVGDASSNGTWNFKEGRFILKSFDVDATYDGEINEISVIKDGKLLPLP